MSTASSVFLTSLEPVSSYGSTVALGILLCAVVWFWWNQTPKGSPPGFCGVPFLGVIPFMRNHPEVAMTRWCRKYGDVCLVKIGLKDVVIVGSVGAMNEAFAKSRSFGDRLQNCISVFDGDLGMLLINGGDFHREQRRFGLNTLRDFGMGRSSLEPRLIDIANELCDRVDSLCGVDGRSEPFNIERMVLETVSDVVSQIMFGHEKSQSSEAICR
uniref:Cytochrome P450 2D28-like n=1 Tax=Phallusia mammillata TaxID=59560 RepID=A0A6F9DAI2_9ASCI|nr:cytochrome P450 2D28-like [Phallusia mammillata]